jgi:hypothetical protein
MMLSKYTMASDPILTAHFINPSHQHVCDPASASQKLQTNLVTIQIWFKIENKS